MPGCLLETISVSADDARAAAAGGADRFEVCSALALGGLTPSIGTIRAIRASTDVPIMAMVRPREGGMAYTEGEFTAMLADAEALLEAGASGLVFGFLTSGGEVDVKRCKSLLKIVRSVSKGRSIETVFHRAFDVAARPEAALEQLIDLGVTRVLTSGRKPSVMEGLDTIRRTVEQARGRIQVLPGGGIQEDNVETVVRETGVTQVHLYAARSAQDSSAAANPSIRFAGHAPVNELEYLAVNSEDVRRIRGILDRI
jgi:copper homeostasis protein